MNTSTDVPLPWEVLALRPSCYKNLLGDGSTVPKRNILLILEARLEGMEEPPFFYFCGPLQIHIFHVETV